MLQLLVESRIPNQYSNNGRLRIGIRHLGQISVSGFRRVPTPAAKSGSVLNSVGNLSGDNSVKTTLDSPDLRSQMVGKMGLGRYGL